ncbi:hypothetical protein [Salinispora arenicola]|nr:hypothetical protein [Salinispora arenicola]
MEGAGGLRQECRDQPYLVGWVGVLGGLSRRRRGAAGTAGDYW